MGKITLSGPWRWTLRLLAGVAVLIAVGSAAAQGPTIRSAAHDGFGRIVFDWTEPTAFETHRSGDELQITFSRPVAADLAAPLKTLPQYLAAATVASDGRTVVFRLKGAVGYRAFPEAKLVVVDLLAAQPSATVETAQAADLESPAPFVLPVRIGSHDEFDRIVFDWPEPVAYSVEQQGERLTIRFDRAAELELASLAKHLPAWIKPGAVRRGATDLTVELIVPAGARHRDFVSGHSVVLDIYRSPKPPAAAPAKSAVASAAPEIPGAGEAKTPAASAPPPQAAPQTPPGDGVTSAEVRAAPGAPSAENAQAGTSAALAPAPRPGTVGVSARAADDALELRFAWDEPTGAAAFRRGDVLWVVFDKERPLTLPDLGAPLLRERGVAGGAVLDGASASVVRLALEPGFEAGMRREGDDWIVAIAKTARPPERALAVKVEPENAEGPRVFLSEAEVGPVIALTDPEAGDVLLVVPLARPGRGVAPGRSFAEFDLLASIQGIAIRPLSDDVRVEGLRGGVAVTSAGGLKLSPLVPGAAPALAASGEDGHVLPIDVWRAKSAAALEEAKHRLLRALALADESFRTAARINLASFYVANDLFADALGVLDAVAREDPDAVNTPRFRALRGVALVQLERYETAEADLLLPMFDRDPDIRLWRALAAAGRRDWPRAAQLFREADLAFFDLPAAWRGPIELAAARVDVETGDPARAGFRLQQAAKAGYPPALQARFDYLRGRVEALLDNSDTALAIWDSVIASDRGEAYAEASLARTELLLARGELAPEQAIEALEQLRFAWRGDALEQELLYKLGELYLGRGDYMKSLSVWRTAAEQFPKEPISATIKERMAEAFLRAYDESKAGKLGPLDAVALFFEFRELTPKGETGDAMIGWLADRLVQMDLLPRAAALLEAQVEQRLHGLEKSRVGARLAVIQLLDGNAKGALEALEISALPGVRLPGALATERRMLEARALFGVGRTAEALERLEGDSREEALKLAADAYWDQQDWPGVADALGRIYAPERAAPQPLDDASRAYLVKYAVALAFLNDRPGLDRLERAYGKAMEGSPSAETFRAMVAKAVPGELPFRDFVKAVADIGPLETFLDDYRQRIQTAGLSNIN